MKEALISYGVPLVLLLAFTLFKRLGQIDSDLARELIQDGARLIDVRSPGEFAAGHLPGALNVPLGEIGSRADLLGPKDAPIILYCASGTRSAVARSTLTRRGFTQIFHLGAMSRWKT
jgi:rhodanese-related sulfurtransferase